MEAKLSRNYTISCILNRSSLQLPVQIQTTNTRELFGLEVLLDYEASGLFINSEFVRTKQINSCQLSQSIMLMELQTREAQFGKWWSWYSSTMDTMSSGIES
jgi:hypothetical protein